MFIWQMILDALGMLALVLIVGVAAIAVSQ